MIKSLFRALDEHFARCKRIYNTNVATSYFRDCCNSFVFNIPNLRIEDGEILYSGVNMFLDNNQNTLYYIADCYNELHRFSDGLNYILPKILVICLTYQKNWCII